MLTADTTELITATVEVDEIVWKDDSAATTAEVGRIAIEALIVEYSADVVGNGEEERVTVIATALGDGELLPVS